MSKDPAFLFYPGDYLRDTQCLSENVQVSYDRIMCEHMRNICISKQQLKFFTKKLSSNEIEELKSVLTEIEGGYQIVWVAESIEKRRGYSESRRKNRISIKKDMINISKSYVEHMENENEIVNEDVNKEENVEKFDFKKSMINYGFDAILVDRWMEVRKKLKAVNSDVAFEGFIREVSKSNQDKNYILRKCVEKSWKGFESTWLDNLNKNENNNKSIAI